MTNEEMERLADLIVSKIFEAEEKAQQEFSEHYEIMMAAKEASTNTERTRGRITPSYYGRKVRVCRYSSNKNR